MISVKCQILKKFLIKVILIIDTNFFLKDTASMVSGALSTFSSLKNEIDNANKK